MIKGFNSNLININFKKKDLFFFYFLCLFATSLNIVKVNLQEFVSLILIALITFCISRYLKSLATILYVALYVRLITIFLGNYLFILPESTGDAILFEQNAWLLAQDGFFGVFAKFPYHESSYYISWILAFIYSLTGKSTIIGQSLSLFFGMGSVLLGMLISNKIWSKKISIRVGWIIALYPTLILYSSLILREAYIWFFLLVAIYGIICWSKDRTIKSIIITLIGFGGATFYHGGMIIGGLVFLGILLFTILIETIQRLGYLKIPIRSIIALILTLFVINFTISNNNSIPKIGKLKKLFDPELAINEMSRRNIRNAAFPEWTVPKTTTELIYKAPIRLIYFMFSPFIWDIKKPSHLIGYFDGLIYLIFFILFFKNFKSIWGNQNLRAIIIILLVYFVLFGLSTGNFGTGIRHRTKFLIATILIIAPWIPKIVFKKK